MDIKVIRDSFALLSPFADKLVERFYEHLFTRYSGVRPLFAHARMEEQRKMLLRSLALVVRKIDDPKYLTNYLRGQGLLHVSYGAKPEYYDAVGECLIAAMKDIAGPAWNETIEKNWLEAYGFIKKTMLEGAALAA